MKLLMLRGLLTASLLMLLMPPLTHAQLPVTDVGNLLQNTIQAGQAVLMVANQILELTGLEEIVLGDDFSSDLDDLRTIAEETRGLSYDVSSLQSQVTLLFSLDTAPNNASELRQRLAAIRRVVFDSYLYAMRTQTLLRTTLSAIRHLQRLAAAVGDLVGNMTANQTLVQLESTTNATLVRLQVQTAAYERAQSVERLTEPLIMESINKINTELMSDYP